MSSPPPPPFFFPVNYLSGIMEKNLSLFSPFFAFCTVARWLSIHGIICSRQEGKKLSHKKDCFKWQKCFLFAYSYSRFNFELLPGKKNFYCKLIGGGGGTNLESAREAGKKSAGNPEIRHNFFPSQKKGAAKRELELNNNSGPGPLHFPFRGSETYCPVPDSRRVP